MAFTREDEIKLLKEMEEAERIKEENMRREDEHVKQILHDRDMQQQEIAAFAASIKESIKVNNEARRTARTIVQKYIDSLLPNNKETLLNDYHSEHGAVAFASGLIRTITVFRSDISKHQSVDLAALAGYNSADDPNPPQEESTAFIRSMGANELKQYLIAAYHNDIPAEEITDSIITACIEIGASMAFETKSVFYDFTKTDVFKASADEVKSKVLLMQENYNSFAMPTQMTYEAIDVINDIEQHESEQSKEKKKRKNTRSLAIENGAITQFNKTAFPGEEPYLKALTRENIFLLPSNNSLLQGESAFQNGKLNPLLLENQNLSNDLKQEIEKPHTGLLGIMMQCVLSSYKSDSDSNRLSLYIPELLSAMGKDPRPYSKKRTQDEEKALSLTDQRAKLILDMIRPWEQFVGRFEDNSYYRFFTFESYQPDYETITVTAPYLFEIARRNDPDKYTWLAHPSIANEKNQTAVEIAMRLLQGLAMRGTTNSSSLRTRINKNGISEEVKVFQYALPYQRIIDECPQIKKELEDIEKKYSEKEPTGTDRQRHNEINTKLRRTFDLAFRIFKEKTDAFQYYKNLRFVNTNKDGSIILPTSSKLSSTKIILEHEGKNDKYKQTY